MELHDVEIYRIRKKSSLLPCSIVPSFRFVQVVLTVCCGATVLLQSCWSQRIRSQATASTRRDAAESSMIQVNCEGKYLYLYIYIYILPKSIYLYILPLIYFGIYSHIYIFIYVSYLCKRMNLMNFQKGLQVKWITFSTWRHQADSSFEKYWSESYLSPGQIRLTDVLTKSKGNKRETRLMQIHISPSGISKSVSEVLCTLCLWIILVWRRLDGIFLLYWSWKVVASCAFPNTI